MVAVVGFLGVKRLISTSGRIISGAALPSVVLSDIILSEIVTSMLMSNE
jgi:hypothetical protein